MAFGKLLGGKENKPIEVKPKVSSKDVIENRIALTGKATRSGFSVNFSHSSGAFGSLTASKNRPQVFGNPRRVMNQLTSAANDSVRLGLIGTPRAHAAYISLDLIFKAVYALDVSQSLQDEAKVDLEKVAKSLLFAMNLDVTKLILSDDEIDIIREKASNLYKATRDPQLAPTIKPIIDSTIWVTADILARRAREAAGHAGDWKGSRDKNKKDYCLYQQAVVHAKKLGHEPYLPLANRKKGVTETIPLATDPKKIDKENKKILAERNIKIKDEDDDSEIEIKAEIPIKSDIKTVDTEEAPAIEKDIKKAMQEEISLESEATDEPEVIEEGNIHSTAGEDKPLNNTHSDESKLTDILNTGVSNETKPDIEDINDDQIVQDIVQEEESDKTPHIKEVSDTDKEKKDEEIQELEEDHEEITETDESKQEEVKAEEVKAEVEPKKEEPRKEEPKKEEPKKEEPKKEEPKKEEPKKEDPKKEKEQEAKESVKDIDKSKEPKRSAYPRPVKDILKDATPKLDKLVEDVEGKCGPTGECFKTEANPMIGSKLEVGYTSKPSKPVLEGLKSVPGPVEFIIRQNEQDSESMLHQIGSLGYKLIKMMLE